MFSVDLADGIHPRHLRHLQIHQDHIGAQLLIGLHGLPAIPGLANHLMVIVPCQEHTVCLADHGVVINYEYAAEIGHGETIFHKATIRSSSRCATWGGPPLEAGLGPEMFPALNELGEAH
ncbi:hypothetical protein SK1NUM_17550 [Arachnia rubra]|nr:hypothetical protein SK1NUM_17550 [Arachnia rubra]